MKVKDLRNALDNYADDLEVLIRASGNEGEILIIASLREVSLQEPCGGADEDDPPYIALDGDQDHDDGHPEPEESPTEDDEPKTERRLKLVKS